MAQEATHKNIEKFSKDQLKHAKTVEKNPLPTADGNTCLCHLLAVSELRYQLLFKYSMGKLLSFNQQSAVYFST